MNARWVRSLALALVMLLLAASLSAQTLDESAVFCGDLSASDCQILKDSDAVMDQVTSITFEMSMLLDVDAAADSMLLTVDASGRMALSAEAMDAAMQMESEHMESASGMMSEEAVAMLDRLIAGMSAEMNAALQISSQGETSELDLHLRIKEGIVAINAAAVAEATGETMEGLEWFGVDANGLFTLLAVDSDLQESMMQDPREDDDALSYASIVRLADDEVNGIPVAVFESEFDAGELMALFDLEATDGIVTSTAAMTGSMRQYIGLSDFHVYRAELAVTAADDAEGSTIDIALDIRLSDFNAPLTVELPADAFIFPLEFLMQM